MKNNKDQKEQRKLQKSILNVFRKSGGQHLNYKQVSRKLFITSDLERKSVLEALNWMEKQGIISQKSRGKYQLATREYESIEGTIEITRSGAGYVSSEGFPGDIFIPRKAVNGALNGDLVEVKVVDQRKKLEGAVIQIIERKKETFVGTVDAGLQHTFVVPDDFRMNIDFYIPEEKSKGAEDGDKVIVRILDWPQGAKSPFAEVLEILGKSGSHDVEMHAIMHEFGLPSGFSDEVRIETDRLDDSISETEIKRRKDFRGVETFTIDPLDAKDFDDALSYQELSQDRVEVGVHIADVSHYVKAGSGIDKEAFDRGTSVYLVDRVIPMLPERISNEICSLRPNEDKLTYSVVFTFDGDGNVLKSWIGKTIIHSNHRFTYEEAQEVLEKEEGLFYSALQALNTLAKKLRKARFNHGSIDFGGAEVRFNLDEQGTPVGISKKKMQDTNRLIEEFMLLANRTVSEHIGKVKAGKPILPFVYRIHDSPDDEKIGQLAMYAEKFGYSMKRLKGEHAARAINQLIKATQDQPEEEWIKKMAIRSMAKAEYSIQNIGHYGLAFDYYSHFTSPIRRYPDLIVHRLLDGYGKQKPYSNTVELSNLCKHASLQEKKAVEAERASVKYKQVEYMSSFIGEKMEGLISGLTSWGIYVEVMDGLCEGMVSLKSLQDDHYYFDDKTMTIVGSLHGHEYTIGDRVEIKVLRTDMYRRQIDFQLID
jgi:ribonuclease R